MPHIKGLDDPKPDFKAAAKRSGSKKFKKGKAMSKPMGKSMALAAKRRSNRA